MPHSIRAAFYVAAALAALAVAFLLSWDGAPHFDFSAFDAAESVAATDGNPYDIETLNSELRDNPDEYGDWWANDDTGQPSIQPLQERTAGEGQDDERQGPGQPG